jgi:hypothetical protein
MLEEAAGAGGAAVPPPGVPGGPGAGGNDKRKIDKITVSVFCAPADPSMPPGGSGLTSYAANLRVFSDLGRETNWNATIAPGVGGVNPKTGLPWVYGSAGIPDCVPDGLSNTIAFTTHYSNCGDDGPKFFFNPADMPSGPFFGFAAPKNPATHGAAVDGTIFQILPTDTNCAPRYTPQSHCTAGLSVALLDGSVRLISSGISPQTWGLALQPNDGLVSANDW